WVRAASVRSSLSRDRWKPGEFFGDGGAGWRRDVLAEMTEKRGGLSKGNRARIVLALSERAAHAVELLSLLACLDAFGNDPHAELSGDLDQGADDGLAAAIIAQALDKGLVNLDQIDRELQQVGERRVASAEIIECDEHMLLAEPLDTCRDAAVAAAAHEDRFADLKHEVFQGHVLAGEGGSDARVEVATVKVGRGDVDADMLKGNAAIQPYAQIYRDGVHDRVGHHVGEARLAEGFLEVLGCEHSTIEVADAGKRFKADDLGRFELDERLVKRRHATLAQGLVNHGDGVEAAGDGGAHAKFEGNEAAAAGRLAVVECQVGVLGKLFSVGRRIAENAACGDV